MLGTLAGHRAERCELTGEDLSRAGLCLVLGGDGTMLRALRLTRYRGVPVAGVALGRVSYFATIRKDRITADLGRVLAGDFVAHPMVGLAGRLGSHALDRRERRGGGPRAAQRHLQALVRPQRCRAVRRGL